jgi:hypothetical protein
MSKSENRETENIVSLESIVRFKYAEADNILRFSISDSDI